jgi:hypothetical protein
MRRAQYILVDCGIMPSGSATGIKREQFVGFAQLNTDSIIRSYDLNDLRIEKKRDGTELEVCWLHPAYSAYLPT